MNYDQYGAWSAYYLSGQTHLDTLLRATAEQPAAKWGNDSDGDGLGATITYSFINSGSFFSTDPTTGYGPTDGTGSETTFGEPWDGSAPLSAEEQASFEAALQTWANVANINFQAVVENTTDIADNQQVGEIRVGFTDLPSDILGRGYYPGPYGGFAGDIWLDSQSTIFNDLTPGKDGYWTMVHEIGHALGLTHPFESSTPLPAETQNLQYTIMSYTDAPNSSIRPAAPMLYDIAAIQYLYGANMSFRSGDDTYTFSVTQEELQAVWDAGGNDLFDCSNQVYRVVINLSAGSFSSIGLRHNPVSGIEEAAVDNIAIAYGVLIEKADGGWGNDTVYGNELGNTIDGRQGNDLLHGNAGNDTIYGGAADNDEIWGEAGSDKIDAGLGDDIVHGDYKGNLSDGNADSLKGGGGKDTIQGGGGADLIYGDYDGMDGNERDLDTTSAGVDILSGGSGGDRLYGGGRADQLYGGLGIDRLNGGGGADKMSGGRDSDIYYVDAAADVVEEFAGAEYGTDIVYSAASYIDPLEANVENLSLQGSAKYGKGNNLANEIRAQTGEVNNVLDGGGSIDHLYGYKGNDQYHVDDTSDIASEVSGGGFDKVYSTAYSYTIASGIEELRLKGTATWGFGNAGDNRVVGTSGSNYLSGGASTYGTAGGSDILEGLSGNDYYFVNSASDVAREGAGAESGTADTVYSNVSIKALFANVENLSLSDPTYSGGSAANGTGNGLNNRISGNSLANRIEGLGGDDWLYGYGGKDTLAGGSGKDHFVFHRVNDSAATISNADLVSDFHRSEHDLIDLSFLDPVPGDAMDQKLAFSSDGEFNGIKGELIAVATKFDTIVKLDIDGDLDSDMVIFVANVSGMVKDDFVL